MPMPLWWGHINKRLFNPRALESGRWAVIRHRGRRSGRAFRTPLSALSVDDTYLFLLVYGSRSDWVQNIVASGSATLEVDGEVVELVSPRVVGRDVALPLLDRIGESLPRFPRIDEFLQMEVAGRQSADPSERAFPREGRESAAGSGSG